MLWAEVVHSEFHEPALGECLQREVSKLVFPQPPTGTARYVEHTFRFDFQTKEEQKRE